jgi:hypothetical protein
MRGESGKRSPSMILSGSPQFRRRTGLGQGAWFPYMRALTNRHESPFLPQNPNFSDALRVEGK